MEIAALCALCLALGMVCGYAIAERYERRKDVSPLPDFDPDNPINAQAREEIDVEGVKLWRIQ